VRDEYTSTSPFLGTKRRNDQNLSPRGEYRSSVGGLALLLTHQSRCRPQLVGLNRTLEAIPRDHWTSVASEIESAICLLICAKTLVDND
jgi:hypothetical protein